MLVLHFIIPLLVVLDLSIFFKREWVVGGMLTVIVLKELYDCVKPSPTGFDIVDLMVGIIGVAIGFVVVTKIKKENRI